MNCAFINQEIVKNSDVISSGDADANDIFHVAITDSIKSYECNKQAAVRIYKQFLIYLE